MISTRIVSRAVSALTLACSLLVPCAARAVEVRQGETTSHYHAASRAPIPTNRNAPSAAASAASKARS